MEISSVDGCTVIIDALGGYEVVGERETSSAVEEGGVGSVVDGFNVAVDAVVG